MYLPAHFAWSDPAGHLAFCRAHSFATVITTGTSNVGAGAEAQHLPLLIDLAEGRFTLRGHAALGDPVWRAAQALAVFGGPHAYVSAAWYGAADTVPTWNYLAVHMSGPLCVIDDAAEVAACFARLAEPDAERTAWQAGLSAEAYGRLAAGVRWFRIDVERVEGKAKLSQNHAVERRRQVAGRLVLGDDAARATGEAMLRVAEGGAPWPSAGG